MTTIRTWAALAVLALGLAAPAAAGPAVDELEALAADDQCASGDEACAVNALQKRYVRMEPDDSPDDIGDEELEDMAARRHHHHWKPRDLDKHWREEIEDKLKEIAENATVMELKLTYLAEDLESAKQRLYKIPNAPVGVNGTVVDWSMHPGSWIPFAANKTKELEDPDEDSDDDSDEDDEEDLEEDVEGSDLEASVASGKHKKKLKRHKKVKGEITVQQKRIALVAPQMGYLKGNITWLNDYMARQPRYLEGKLVLTQQEVKVEKEEAESAEQQTDVVEEAAHAGSMTNRRRRTTPPEEEQQPREPQEDLLDMIEDTWGMANKIWDSFDTIGMETEAVKRRIELWRRGHPPLPQKYAVSDDLPTQELVAEIKSHADDLEEAGRM